jgi:poly-beta-1,6-N-acetyl-D-glucosamine N-deacetylase
MDITIRNLFGWSVANLLILSGFVRRRIKKTLNNQCIVVLYFHKPSAKEFESCIRWLKKNKFNFLSASDLDKISQKEIPFPRGSVILTVDDGWKSNEANVVEIANKHKVPVTIFISTEPVEEGAYWWSYLLKARQQGLIYSPVKSLKKLANDDRLSKVNEIKELISLQREAMSVEQVKNTSVSPYVTIGGHTHTHPILINCDDQHVYHELKISRQKLESWIGKEVPYFAYPNGDYGQREIEILRKLNYRWAFTDQPSYLTPDFLNNNLVLPRFGFLEGASFAENICRIVGVWKPIMQKFNPLLFLKRFR